MASGFSDLQLKAASEFAVFAAHRNLAKISLFSHTFTELNGRPGESVAVPVYDLSASAAFVAGTNDYGSGVNEVGGMLVSLDQHLVKSVAITDSELAFTGINWVKDTASALASRITRDVNAYVFGLINSTNVALTADVSLSDVAEFANLHAVAELNDIPADKCVVVLNPTYFAKAMALAKYAVTGTPDYIKTGVIENLFGFKGIVESSNLVDGVGAIVLDEAMGVASKYLAPFTPDAYPESWSATDESGFTLGFRRFMDLAKGQNLFAVDALFGAKILQPKKIVRLVEA